MTKDDITRMAREAGAHDDGFEFRFKEPRYLERFAALVIANRPPQSSMAWQEGFEAGRLTERDACCDLLEGMHVAGTGSHNYYLHAATELRRLRNARSIT